MVRELTEKEREEMMKEFLQAIKFTHHSFLSIMYREFGLRKKPKATIIVPVAGEESGLVIQSRRIAIATGEVDSSLRDNIEYKNWIFEAAYHTAHESGHYLHYKVNPRVMKPKKLRKYQKKGRGWFLDEVVAELGAIIYLFGVGKEEYRRSVKKNKVIKTALRIYEEEREMLPVLARMNPRDAETILDQYAGRN